MPAPLRSLRVAAAAAACAGALAIVHPGPAPAQMVMLYDTADAVRTIATGPSGLDADRFNIFQQQPVARVLAPTRQAWKVSARGPSTATPGLRGRSVNSMVSLLRDRIQRSGGHMVFIDEAGIALHNAPEDALNLAAALEILSHQTLPQVHGQPLNERVHIYVQGVPAPLVRSDQWTAIWQALARSGGVWWQAYTSVRAWNEAEWATWPALIERTLLQHGGDPLRLRWVLRHDASTTMADQLGHAARGPACTALANGIAVWRSGPEAAAFRDGYRALVDAGVPCTAAPVPSAAQSQGLHAVTALEAGVPLADRTLVVGAHGAERLPAGSLPQGVPARLRLNLGADPLGIAATLGLDPVTFWAGAGASVTVSGGGLAERWPLVAGRTLDVYVLPQRLGVVNVTLHLPVRALRAALGGTGVDLLATLESVGGPRTPALARRLIQSPAGAALSIPLRASRGGNLLTVRRAPAAVPARAHLLFPARLSGNRVAPRHIRPVAVRLRDGRGRPVPGARARLRLPGGRTVTVRVGADGTGRLAIPRRAGPHLLTVPGTRVRVVRRLTAPRTLRPVARPAVTRTRR